MRQQFCPVHTPIPQAISLFKQNRQMEAGEVLFRNDPLPSICSIENYISDMYLD